MQDHEVSTLRMQRTDAAFNVYIELVTFMERVGPIQRGWQALAAGIATTIIDGLAAVCALINSNGQCHTQAVLRGMIEASLDLVLLVENHDYADSLILATQVGVKRKLSRELETGLTITAHRGQLAANLDEAARQVDVLKQRGVKVPSIGDKFAKAPEHYRSLQPYYDRWNAYVHNNLEAVLNRHFKPHGLQFGDTVDDDEAHELLIMAVLMATETLNNVAQYTTFDAGKASAEHDRLIAEVEQIAAPLTLPSGKVANEWFQSLPPQVAKREQQP